MEVARSYGFLFNVLEPASLEDAIKSHFEQVDDTDGSFVILDVVDDKYSLKVILVKENGRIAGVRLDYKSFGFISRCINHSVWDDGWDAVLDYLGYDVKRFNKNDLTKAISELKLMLFLLYKGG